MPIKNFSPQRRMSNWATYFHQNRSVHHGWGKSFETLWLPRLRVFEDESSIYVHKRASPNAIHAIEASDPETTCEPARFGVDSRVPTYIYETTDTSKPIRSFEVKQSVHDDALRVDPKTGEAARRVISAGYGVLVRGKSMGPSVGSVGSHSGCD